MASWNPWHGCKKLSEGCRNCYVYRQDGMFDKDSSKLTKNRSFDMPISRNKNGEYKIKPDETVYTCFTSDFFLEAADDLRIDAWDMIRRRSDLTFIIFTKRVDRFYKNLPFDWGGGYENVVIGCSIENQNMADYRLPIYMSLPIAHKMIICAPLLSKINLLPYLDDSIDIVSAGGESGPEARTCDYGWVLDIRRQCAERGVNFVFHQTGAKLKKDGKIYIIKRKHQHSQAKKANINLGGNR